MPIGSPRHTNPLQAACPLLRRHEDGTSTVGSCFAFRQPDTFLTALHCVGDAPAEELFVGIDLHNGAIFAQSVVDVRRNDTADAALLFSGSHPDTTPFWDLHTDPNLGEDFMAYGFPADIASSHAMAPRLFRGHYQRFPPIWHQSHNGCRYRAVELSIACPPG